MRHNTQNGEKCGDILYNTILILHSFIKCSKLQVWMSPRCAMQGRLLQIAQDGYYKEVFKKLLSGIRLVEKIGVVVPLVQESD